MLLLYNSTRELLWLPTTMRLNSHFIILFLLFLLLLLACANHVECSPSTPCGSLHNISSPFHLESGTPRAGGSPSYEILCDGGKPMVELGSAKYYVTNISYTNQTISVVDPVFVDGDRYCHLPIASPPPAGFSDLYLTDGQSWALFVNCTRPIRTSGYRRVPCLSSNNTFYVYVVVQTYAYVDLIGTSCGFLAAIPVGDVVGNSTATGIFELLKEGFVLSWYAGPRPQAQPTTPSAMFHGCLKEAKRYELRTPAYRPFLEQVLKDLVVDTRDPNSNHS